jgi:hypothetical protein
MRRAGAIVVALLTVTSLLAAAPVSLAGDRVHVTGVVVGGAYPVMPEPRWTPAVDDWADVTKTVMPPLIGVLWFLGAGSLGQVTGAPF